MSWMDDGGFDMQAFTAQDGRPMARMSFRTSTGQYYFNLTKTKSATRPTRMQSNPQGNGSKQMTSHDQLHDSGQAGNTKPNYTLRRIKTLLAIIACTASATLLFTWRTADSQTATILVSVIYLLTGLWLIVRFAPRD